MAADAGQLREQLHAHGARRRAALDAAGAELDAVLDLAPEALDAGISLREVARLGEVGRPTLYARLDLDD